MYYISSIDGNRIGITDSFDNVEEFYSKREVHDIVKVLGIRVFGAKLDSDGNLLLKVVEHEKSAVELAKRLIVDSIWKSARLEGLATTFPKTEAILEGINVNTNRDEMLFILNMKNAWKFLLDTIDYANCIGYVRKLNGICGAGLFYGCGEIRKSVVTIGGTNWVPDIPFESDIVTTISELDKISDRELCALKMFCYFTRSQLFIDGNKRVAQLMANKVLLNANIGIFQVPVDKTEHFKELLILFYESNNDTDIIDFMHKFCIGRI